MRGGAARETQMATMTIVYWRDIPAQVIVKAGRNAAKRQLPERFEQAIDRCAMKVGARDTDALENLSRYEATIDRSLARARDQLQRLQMDRQERAAAQASVIEASDVAEETAE